MHDGKNRRLAEAVFEVEDIWRCDGHVHKRKPRIDIGIANVRGPRHACPNCGAEHQPVRDTKPRSWRRPPVGDRQCRVEARVPRVECGGCGKV